MALSARDFGRDRHYVIGRRIAERRQELGLSQTGLAQLLQERTGLIYTGVSIGNMEAGKQLDPAKVMALAIALDCSLTYIHGWTDDPQKWEPDDRKPRV